MTKTVQGHIHGRTIQLLEDLGVEEGQSVEVTVRIVPQKGSEGLLRMEGALESDIEWDEWDEIMAEIYRDRKRDFRPDIPE